MTKINTKPEVEGRVTHGGGKAFAHVKPAEQLRRSVLACMLWEDEFYEDGQSIAARIREAAEAVPVESLAMLAVEARTEYNLRHVPLLLLTVLARRGNGKLVEDAIFNTIQRADEIGEFLAIYAQENGVTPDKVKAKLSNPVRKGIARAFGKFDAYQLAKYNRAAAITLRDAAFLCHAKAKDLDHGRLLAQLTNKTFFPQATKSSGFTVAQTYGLEGKPKLATPDTWEVALSGGGAKKDEWERLLRAHKLGYLALLRNLRNMERAGVDRGLIRDALAARKGAWRVLPFRYIAAAKHAPKFADEIDAAFLASLREQPKLPGKTVVIIDVSGSMYHGAVSKNSDMTRAHAACALAAIAREKCEEAAIYATAGNDGTRIHKTAEVPNRHGMALVDGIYDMCHPLGGGGIFLTQVMDYVLEREKSADRIIVITDEQDCSGGGADAPANAKAFGAENYLINVSSYQNGIGYGKWTHINGFSEAVFSYIGACAQQ